jgi:hypothetical protein
MANSLINKYGEPITILRPATGAYVDGVFVPGGAPASSTATACVMPLSEEDIALLPEGQEDKDGIVVYTETELKSGGEVSQTTPDLIEWDGKTWQVMQSKYRSQIPSLAHWKVIALLEDVG